MALTAEEYKELRDLVNTPGLAVDDATRTAALQATAEYENQNLQGYVDAKAAAPPVEDLSGNLDPNLPLVPQALSIQPSTTHPGGDDAARNEWSVNAGKGGADALYVYDAPVSVARKKMLEDQAMVAAIYPEMPPDPQALANMKPGDEYHQAYNDFEWRRAADAAAKAGTTAYRYSKTPWLQGENMRTVDSLSTKVKGSLKPYGEGVRSFILGVDDTAALGAGRKAVETAGATVEEPNSLLGIKSVGGIETGDAKTVNAQTIEEHPTLNTAGQGLGLLVGWSPSNLLFKAATSVGEKAIGPAAGLVKRTLAAGTSGAIGASGDQAMREGVNAAASVAQGENPGSLAEAGERVKGAGVGGLVGGAALHGVSELAGAATTAIRSGPRFRGLPEQLENQGVEFSASPLKSGPITPKPLLDAERRAVQQGLPAERAGDVLAKDIAGPVSKAASAEHANRLKQVESQQGEYLASPEAKIRRPANNLVTETVNLLRRKHGETPDGLQRLQVDGPTPKLKKVFNNEVGKVSLEPSKGAIELTPDEAEAFLNSSWQEKLLPGAAPKPSGGGGPGIKPMPSVPVGEAPTVPPKGKEAKAAGKVEAIPDRDLKPTFKTEATNAAMKEQESIVNARPGIQKDNAVGRKLDAEFNEVPATEKELSAMFTGTEASQRQPIVDALTKRGVVPTVDRVHALKVSGLAEDNLKTVSSPDFNGQSGRRALGISAAPKLDVAKVKALTAEADKAADRLSEAEVDAVRSYTSRKGDKVGSPEWESAVKKLTVQNPTDAGPLYHGTRMSDDQLATMLKAGKFETKEPTSLSFNKDLSDAFAHGREQRGKKVVFEVQSLKEGAAFTPKKLGVGRSGLEREINLANPTKFDVVSHSVDKEGVTHVILRDVALGGAAGAATAAATGGNESEGAAAAGGLGLASALKRRGIAKVYVTPHARNAAEHEEVIRGFKPKMNDDPDVLKKLKRAALQDRDAWTRNGEPGGWSKLQGEHSVLIGEGKSIKQLAGGDANKSFKILTAHGKSKPGELLSVEALRKAADKAGVREQLEQIRMLGPLEQLQSQASLLNRGSLPVGRRGIANAAIDAGGIRAFPGLRYLSGDKSPIRAGMGGRAEMLRDEEKEERK